MGITRDGSRMAKGLLVANFWIWEDNGFLFVGLCLKGVVLLGIRAERATTKQASAGWEVKAIGWVSGDKEKGDKERGDED